MKTITYRTYVVSMLATIFLSACGGSSGGGTPAVVTDGGNSLSTIPNVAAQSCAISLSDLVIDNRGLVPGGVLGDVSAGCDYIVERDTLIAGSLIIQPGVSIVLEAGVTLTFAATANTTGHVELLGTAAAPIAFLPSPGADQWSSIRFRADELTIANTVVVGGGLNIDDTNAAVEIDSEIATLTNFVVQQSLSNGLLLSDSDSEQLTLSNVSLISNEGFGMLLSDLGLAEFLDDSIDFGLGTTANEQAGVGVIQTFGAKGKTIPDIGAPYVFLVNTRNRGTIELDNTLITGGVEMQFYADSGLEFGEVTVAGTVENPVSFSGVDGAEWGGIQVGGSGSVIRNVTILNAGSGDASVGGALAVNQTQDTVLENIAFTGSTGYGIFCPGSSTSEPSVLNGINFSDSGIGDIHPNCNYIIGEPLEVASSLDVTACSERFVAAGTIRVPFKFSNTDAECDYFIIGDMKIESTVQIDPGTTIVFSRAASLTTTNTFIARGTLTAPIRLLGEFQSDGYWAGLTIGGRGHELIHVAIEDGGMAEGAGLAVSQAFSGDTAREELIFDTVSVTGSGGDGLVMGTETSFNRFTNNTFIGNAGFGVRLGIATTAFLDDSSIYDSAMAPNGQSGVQIVAGAGNAGSILLNRVSATLANIGAPWQVKQFSISSGQSLTVEAGSSLEFLPGGGIELESNGAVNLNGTATQRIKVSGLREDEGNWNGVSIRGATLTATHTDFVGGGRQDPDDRFGLTTDGTVSLGRGGSINLSDTSISNSGEWGISCSGTDVDDLMLSRITYSDNTLGNIQLECGS